MNFEDITWIFVATSVIGNAFVIKKNVGGQWICAIANLGWMCFDISIGAYSQAVLFGIYFFICIWGVIVWSKEKENSLISLSD
ncbi:MAG: hypothetical protein Q8K60_07415 [Parachlamydiaceae bacterium]|nr:hypothetical protein [Parachlamydiaceae bacterium]